MLESVFRFLEEEDHDEELSPADKSTVRTVKIIVMIVLLLAGCFVFFPFSRVVNNKKTGCCKGAFFGMLTSFAAGMLLSLSFMHILPEAAGIYKKIIAAEHKAEEAAEAAAKAAKAAAVAAAKAGKRYLEEEEHGEEGGEGFPLPNVIFFIGFMLMLFLDQVAFKSGDSKHDEKEKKDQP